MPISVIPDCRGRSLDLELDYSIVVHGAIEVPELKLQIWMYRATEVADWSGVACGGNFG